ncbi:methyltransferase family protein, partial [Nocardia nova]
MAELIAETVCPHCGADPDTDTITDLLATRWIGYAMTTAAELGIADALADGPRTAAAIAAATGADEVGVTGLLRALATIGLVRQLDGDELFESTAAGAALRTDAPGSLRDA